MSSQHEAEQARAWFEARRWTLRTYREGDEYWVDLIGANPRVAAVKYGRGETLDVAIVSAKRRWDVEQGPA